MPITAIKLAISVGVLLFMANQAGIARYVMPSGIPCAKYKAEKVQ